MKKWQGILIAVAWTLFLVFVSLVLPAAYGHQTTKKQLVLPDQQVGKIDFEYYTSDMPDWYGKIIKIADGDTFYIDFYSEKKMGVRVKGIDTPETKDHRKKVQFWGPEASEYAKSVLKPGTIVKLDFEGEITGPFGRLLAYVWYWNGKQWVFWQEELLKSGNAFVYWNYEFELPELFLEWQAEAIINGRGIWSNPEAIENDIVIDIESLDKKAGWYKR